MRSQCVVCFVLLTFVPADSYLHMSIALVMSLIEKVEEYKQYYHET
jgi:hypothetical protein